MQTPKQLANAREARRLVDLGAGAMRPEHIELRICRTKPDGTEVFFALWQRGGDKSAAIVGWVTIAAKAGAVRAYGPCYDGAATFGAWPTTETPLSADERAEHLAAAKDAICDYYSRKAAGIA